MRMHAALSFYVVRAVVTYSQLGLSMSYIPKSWKVYLLFFSAEYY